MSKTPQDLEKSKRPRSRPKELHPTAASLEGPEAGGRLISASFSAFSGPLPPPETLARYNEVYPGCAEAIVEMAQRQSRHRQQLEAMVLTANLKNESRGQYLAFILAVLVIGIGGLLIWNDKDPQGLALILADLAALAGLFVYGRESKKKELRQKREEQDRAAAGP